MRSIPISRGHTMGARSMKPAADGWYARIARAGFAAKGVVYVLVGILAASAAIGGGRAEGSEGALRILDGGPAGIIVLGVIALGLVGYVLWRLLSAIANPEHDRVPKRIAHLFSGLVYAALAVEAARLAISGASGATGGEEAAHWTAAAMTRPFGIWAVAIAGAGLLLFALYQIYRGSTKRITQRLDLPRASSTEVEWIERTGRAGIVARGVVLGLMAVFLVQAALQADPSEARGLGGALRALQQQPYGPWLLGGVALGLIAYGLFQLVQARYRRLATP